MARLFVAIDVPDRQKEQLELMQGGVPEARWQRPEQMHLTLTFLGEIDGGVRETCAALDRVDAAPLVLQLHGAGVFPPSGRPPRALWTGLRPVEPLVLLKRKIDAQLRGCGVEFDRRQFRPHVTLGRLRGRNRAVVGDWIAQHSLFVSEEFVIAEFCLYSSVLSPKGSKYVREEAFELDGGLG